MPIVLPRAVAPSLITTIISFPSGVPALVVTPSVTAIVITPGVAAVVITPGIMAALPVSPGAPTGPGCIFLCIPTTGPVLARPAIGANHIAIPVAIAHAIAAALYANTTIDAVAGAGNNPFARDLPANLQFAIVAGDSRPGTGGQNYGRETCCD